MWFQASNEPDFGFRMLDYWVYFRREHGQPVRQCVFYMGIEPMRLQPWFEEGQTRHGYEIVNLQDYDAGELLASADWGDNLWALGARGERTKVLEAVLGKLVAMPRAEQEAALAELTAFSGILKLDELLKEKLKEFRMLDIDLQDNAVVRPLIERGRQEGRLEGRQEGRLEGRLEGRQEARQELLAGLLSERFGLLPAWALTRIQEASGDQLDRWARRLLKAKTLEETLI